jgi:hypothetical protein
MVAMIKLFVRPRRPACQPSTAVLAGVLAFGCAGNDSHGDTQADPTTGPTSTAEALDPAEGRWILSRGAEVERTCTGSQLPRPLAAEYTLTNTGETSFTLAYPPMTGPVHECTRDGSEFECPPLFIVGDCCSSVEIGFSGTFESDNHATGFVTFRFDAVEIPGGTATGGETTGGTGTGGPEDCCPDFGDVNPCMLTHSLDAVWTAG